MKFPAVFVSHGAPTLALDSDEVTYHFLRGLGATLGRPCAIVCVSAHWEADVPTVTAAPAPATIHDFYGFPLPLYALRYNAPGDPELAQDVAELLITEFGEAVIDPVRGYDHGAWVPLSLMYPAADIPVLQVSLQTALGAEHQLEVGRALAHLREKGILILGSGGATHDLRRATFTHGASTPPPDVAAFESWLVDAVTLNRRNDLVDWRAHAPFPDQNHPTHEHFLPLFVPLGAATPGVPGRVLQRTFAYGVLSMAAFAWD